MTITEYIMETLSNHNQTERDIHWIWYIHPTDALKNKPVWLDDEMLIREIETREDGFTFILRDLNLYIFTKDYTFIVCEYNGYHELQPVPNSMMVASRMTEYPRYGG